ncbi:MAG: GNAT family N-acetyltransferase [Clostridia bacterium]|nr:GNAT family N-acetyltransferase [Clostridia bacterium]
MDYSRIDTSQIDRLWELQKAYKAEIGEDAPGEPDKNKLLSAVEKGQIAFFGAFDEGTLIGCCSVTAGFSTFDYAQSGVFEDFYICPEYRHKGVARELVQYAYRESGVSSMTVGCAGCDVEMYRSLGFGIPLGNLLAFGE